MLWPICTGRFASMSSRGGCRKAKCVLRIFLPPAAPRNPFTSRMGGGGVIPLVASPLSHPLRSLEPLTPGPPSICSAVPLVQSRLANGAASLINTRAWISRAVQAYLGSDVLDGGPETEAERVKRAAGLRDGREVNVGMTENIYIYICYGNTVVPSSGPSAFAFVHSGNILPGTFHRHVIGGRAKILAGGVTNEHPIRSITQAVD